jgi:hypothetical protein
MVKKSKKRKSKRRTQTFDNERFDHKTLKEGKEKKEFQNIWEI